MTSQSLCVAHPRPPSTSPSSLTPGTQTLSLPAPTTGRPSTPFPVPPLPRVSGTRMTPYPLRTHLSWVALQEPLLPLPPAHLRSTGVALLEILRRTPKLTCPGRTLSPLSGPRSFLPPPVPPQPSGHLPSSPSTVPVVLPMLPRLNSVL